MTIERTLSIIKPDATRRNLTGAINDRFERKGLRIIAQKRVLITREQAEDIGAKWRRRASVPQRTKLGGGIGFHGWIKEWDNAGSRHLSWGCVVLHLYDISRLYEQNPEGAMVVIF